MEMKSGSHSVDSMFVDFDRGPREVNDCRRGVRDEIGRDREIKPRSGEDRSVL